MVIDLLDLPCAGAFWGIFIVGEGGDSSVLSIVCSSEDDSHKLEEIDRLAVTDIADEEVDKERVRDDHDSLFVCLFEICPRTHDTLLDHVTELECTVCSSGLSLEDIPTEKIPEREWAKV